MEKSSEISGIEVPKAVMSKIISNILKPPKLLKYTHKNIDMFYTRDIKKERKLNNKCVLDLIASQTAGDFLEFNKGYEELIETYAKKNNLEGIAVLLAHGDEIDNTWCYYNGDRAFSVQSWINKMDGKYKALILYSCNPGRNEITSEKSPVLVPNEKYSHVLLLKGRVQVELFLPKTGYIDSYMIEKEIENLKK